MSFPKRLYFPPLSPPTNVVPWYLAFPWALPADSLDPYVLKRSPQPADTVLCTGSPNAAAYGPGPLQPPRPVREYERASLQWLLIPRLAARSPLRPAAGGMRAAWLSRVHPPRRFWGPGLDVLPPSSHPSAPRGAAGLAGRGGASVCAGGRQLRPRRAPAESGPG